MRGNWLRMNRWCRVIQIDMESLATPQGNSESEKPQHALKPPLF